MQLVQCYRYLCAPIACNSGCGHGHAVPAALSVPAVLCLLSNITYNNSAVAVS